jgi:thiol-disulfide isomerase/thioredoxin
VGVYESAVARVILGKEKEVKLWANAPFMEKGRTFGSEANKAYEEMVKRTTALQNAIVQNPANEKAKSAYLDSLKRTNNKLLWRSATLLLHPNYQGTSTSKEAEFYALNYLQYAQLASDRAYDQIPDVFTAFSDYVRTIVRLGASENDAKRWINDQLTKIPADSRTYRMALGGLYRGAEDAQYGPLMLYFGQMYLDKYQNDNWGEISRIKYTIGQASTNTPGMIPPDLAGPTPDSSAYSLYQMRGKVVLVDFWASWCGPCRRENPNVRALYAKYKDKGFDILGVSLDRDATAWKKAIADDQLVWHHISDLKGWQSAHAAMYGVSSIPQTLLLDREGRIIERNLRGEALGEKLKTIFGE